MHFWLGLHIRFCKPLANFFEKNEGKKLEKRKEVEAKINGLVRLGGNCFLVLRWKGPLMPDLSI